VTLGQILARLDDQPLCGPYRQMDTASAWLRRLTREELGQEAELVAAADIWPSRVRVWGAGEREGGRGRQPALLRRGDVGIVFTFPLARPRFPASL
jgi:hypothetical protein